MKTESMPGSRINYLKPVIEQVAWSRGVASVSLEQSLTQNRSIPRQDYLVNLSRLKHFVLKEQNFFTKSVF